METFYTYAGNSVYFFQAILAFVGAYALIMVWRRVANTEFDDEEEQDEFLGEFEQALAARNYDAAAEICEGDRRTLPQLALFAVVNRDQGYSKLRGRVGERFQQDVMSDIEHRLSWVGTAIKTAPMLGLLGTVMGMMGAFANLSSGEKVDPTQMAEDIQFALITTAVGLAIAVPLMVGLASVNIRIRKMEDLTGVGLGRLFDTIRKALPQGA
ncbi:MAG: MotA/TolQ/ExbB proton channel family protein [Pirellulales bacterium]|nr:MotA/TolQ/ExbB proton channel family protein [Pirellulales bacterium]